MDTCKKSICDNRALSAGFCMKHYKEDYERRKKEAMHMSEPTDKLVCQKCGADETAGRIFKKSGFCKKCRKAEKPLTEGATRGSVKGGGKNLRPMAPPPPPKRVETDKGPVEPMKLTIDFTGREALLADIKRMAHIDVRTPEMQVVAILKEISENLED